MFFVIRHIFNYDILRTMDGIANDDMKEDETLASQASVP